MKSTARIVTILLLSSLACTAFAQALPGQIDKATGVVEALMKAKWVMVLGAFMIMGLGWRFYNGKMTLEEFLKVAVAVVLIFGGGPIAYALFPLLNS